MTLNLTIPQQAHTDFTPRITVIGVGGGGTNAVDNMIAMNLQGVEFVIANTDAQQLLHSHASRRIQLGPHITQGLGAGAKPEIGRAAAEEAAEELYRQLDGTHMVFVTAGMGGGTGTGAAPVIARMARERGILTVGVVTKPFTFEGARRMRSAEAGIEELQQFVDTLIVIPNQNLFRLANERTGWKEAFKMADNVLYMGVRGVTDLMVAPGLVNLDFADIRTVMAEMGKAMMGTGESEGENRAIRAAEAAINNPLLEDTSMSGARGLLINITGGDDMTLFEVDQAANRIREEVDEDANIIFGSAIDESLQGKVRVSVVATGIESAVERSAERPKLVAVPGGMPAAVGQAPVIASAPQAAAFGPVPGIGAPAMSANGSPASILRQAANPLPARGPQPTPRALQGAYPLHQAMPATARQAPMPQPMPLQAAPQPIDGMTDAMQGHLNEGRLREMVRADEAAEAAAQEARRQAAPRGAPRPTERAPARSGLFAEAPGGVSAPQPAAAPRKSLFGIVTGAIRGSHHAADPAPAHPEAPRAAPVESLRADVRQTAGEEMPLDIPAFLRRQSS